MNLKAAASASEVSSPDSPDAPAPCETQAVRSLCGQHGVGYASYDPATPSPCWPESGQHPLHNMEYGGYQVLTRIMTRKCVVLMAVFLMKSFCFIEHALTAL